MQIAVMDNVGSLTRARTHARTCIHTQTSLFSLSLPLPQILDVLHKMSGVWGGGCVVFFFVLSFSA